MKKRIIKTIIALALTVALCPTVPTLAAQEDYKDIYFDFIKSTLQDVYGVQLSDLNLDGIPELILYDSGAGSSAGINIFEIIDDQVELRYGGMFRLEDTYNKNYLDSQYILMGGMPFDGVSISPSFSLRKNINTGEVKYIIYTYKGDDSFGETGLFTISTNYIFNITEQNYITFKYSGMSGEIISANYRINSYSASLDEYDTAYNEFISTWQGTGYQIAYRDVTDNKMTDSEIKDFLNSYIPERKALGLDISVTVNGNEIDFDQPPVIVDERTLVPLRAIFEALGATVDWNGNTQTVTSTLDNTTVALTIGSNTMYKNGEAITLDVPAQLIGDRTLVPVRAIAEAYGATVDWEQATYTVKIQK